MKSNWNESTLSSLFLKDNAEIIGEFEKNLNQYTKILFRCSCGNESRRCARQVVNNGGAFCTSCIRKKMVIKQQQACLVKYGTKHPSQLLEIQQKIKENTLKKYGVPHVSMSEEIQNKRKATCIEKYGVHNALMSSEIKQKIKETNLKKYGVPYTMMNQEIRQKAIDTNLVKQGVPYTMMSNDVRQKAIDTNLEKYGVPNAMMSEEVREKSKATCMEKYGFECVLSNPEIQEKIKETNSQRYGGTNPSYSETVRKKREETSLEHFGVRFPFQSDEIKEKIVKSNIEKYGVSYAIQCPEVFEKQQASAYTFKDYIMPSGKIRRVQGYEPFALDILIKQYSEEEILTSRGDVSIIKYHFDEKDKVHYPDIEIRNKKFLIEVKSTWTYKLNPDKILAKQKAAEEQGYTYEIWCFNNKGQLVNPADL